MGSVDPGYYPGNSIREPLASLVVAHLTKEIHSEVVSSTWLTGGEQGHDSQKHESTM
ncbi:hypothetical protein BDQ94DRAFT_144108 [Aspergillus welwitschiae]|uniref:Uncharacterized protein n=1 Tax=Aspergillus welwitschiae TaxID=1341132 RepID=A0A3F3Q1K6_9EURO|nr:hypothetical protein BDQ94DRAFT_144108 [Aspergillus welwitschiae]RDH32872.1 hypothetical protein BDQ94DRAFT_144108 [Aspergillus welwitschiae]